MPKRQFRPDAGLRPSAVGARPHVLNQGYLLGLRLAQIEPGHPLAGSPFLARARDSATCLARLADALAPEPPETCVDETRIAACLGATLVK